MSSIVAAAYTSLLRPLTIELYVVAHVHALLNKPVVSVGLASRAAYEIISYLAAECIA
jgi:hypothetical protein